MDYGKTFEGHDLKQLWFHDGVLSATPGSYINDVVKELVDLADEIGKLLEIDFNGIAIKASPGSTYADVLGEWTMETDLRYKEYLLEQERNPPPPPPPKDVEPNGDFKLSKPEDWATAVGNQKSGYGKACFTFAERWARKLQYVIDTCPETPLDEVMKRHADRLSHDADIEGITGFMYGCAVSVLSFCWEHGDALRRWHNLDTQVADEGEKANESGGVLNPALLTIGSK